MAAAPFASGRWALLPAAALVIAVALLAARHFATTAWPLSGGHPGWLVASGLLMLLAQALKAFGWARLFAPKARPRALALAAGNGGAALIGVVLPGRFDDAMRIAVVRRSRLPRQRARTRPLPGHARPDRQRRAGAARGRRRRLPGAGILVRVGLARGRRRGRGRRIDRRPAPARREQARAPLPARPLAQPPHDLMRPASEAWALVSACWLVRAVALFMLLGTLGVGFSFPLALLFLCAGAAAAALPIGPAGAATQAGASGAALIGSGSRHPGDRRRRLRRSARRLLRGRGRSHRHCVACRYLVASNVSAACLRIPCSRKRSSWVRGSSSGGQRRASRRPLCVSDGV